MNNLQIFNNDEFGQVRVLEIDNEPWFMLSDLCRVLEIKNSRDAKSRLNINGVGSTDIIDSMGRNQQADFINESNLYKLVFQSRKPQAERFSEWVTGEVLPSIRKHGMYAVKELSPKELLELQFKYSKEIEKEVKEVKEEVSNQDKTIKRLENNLRRNITSDYFTVIAYANMNCISAKRYNSSQIGRKASQLCRRKQISIGKIVDSKYGYINTYPVEILDKVFREMKF